TVGGLGGRLDVPGEHRHAEPLGDVTGENRLAGPRLSLQQERTLEGDRAVDGVDQRAGSEVARGALKALKAVVFRHAEWIICRGRAVQAGRSRAPEVRSSAIAVEIPSRRLARSANCCVMGSGSLRKNETVPPGSRTARSTS